MNYREGPNKLSTIYRGFSVAWGRKSAVFCFKMETKGTLVVLFASILSVPIAYFVNLIPGISEKPIAIFIIGLSCLLVAFLIPALAKVYKLVKNDDPLYYGMLLPC